MTESIKTVEEFVAWTRTLHRGIILFRGLADEDWELESSAYRRLKKSNVVTSEKVPVFVFQNYVEHLLDEAGLLGLRERQDRSLSDLEMLSELQHFGAATCLMDFTTSALIALYFACRKESGKSGKVVAMATESVEKFSTVSYEDLKKPAKEFLSGERLWKWEPSSLNNRIVAQQSVFVLGKGRIEGDSYENIKISGSHKNDILGELGKSFGINERKLFNDLAGFAKINAHDLPYYSLSAEDFHYQGIELHQQGKHDRALLYFDRAIELRPEYSVAFYNRGNANSWLGKFQDAIDDYSMAIKHHSRNNFLFREDVDAYINRGNAKSSLGDQHGAIEDFSIAIDLSPRNTRAYTNRAHCRNVLGDHEGAIIDCNRAIELDPKNALAFNNRGDARRGEGDHMEAITDYDKAIEYNPKLAEAFLNRGEVKRAEGDEEGAMGDFRAATRLGPSIQPPEL